MILNMKYYTLSYVLDSKTICVRKKFKTRTHAINYAFNKMPIKTQILYEIEKAKHDIEYVCNNFNRIFISRCIK